MPEKHRKVRYRANLRTLDSLERDVRELTGEIKTARKELLDELPAKRRSDLARPAPQLMLRRRGKK
jgi:hypothetical protein